MPNPTKQYIDLPDMQAYHNRMKQWVVTQAGAGEPNVIDTIEVNGTEATVTDKTVNISVPTAISDLTNDSNFVRETYSSTEPQSALIGDYWTELINDASENEE